MRPPDLQRDRLRLVLLAEEAHPIEVRLRYREACKRLLRSLGLRIIEMDVVEDKG